MGKEILRDVSVTINGVELSDHASSVAVNSSKDLVETTSFGATYKSNLIGLGDASFDVTFYQDFDAASVDATLSPLHNTQAVFQVVIKPRSGVVSATNPSFTMPAAVLPEFSPLNGGVGEASTTDVSFQNAGQLGIVRSTTPPI